MFGHALVGHRRHHLCALPRSNVCQEHRLAWKPKWLLCHAPGRCSVTAWLDLATAVSSVKQRGGRSINDCLCWRRTNFSDDLREEMFHALNSRMAREVRRRIKPFELACTILDR